MPAPSPTLETDRLILRAPCAADLEPWTAFAADEEVMRHLGGVQTASGAWRGLCSVIGAWEVRGHSMFSVIEKASGRWIGRLGPWQPQAWPGTEVGWGLAREAWGKGYASEGATAAIDWAFAERGWTEVIHCIEAGNTNSKAVAKRLGSAYLRDATLPAPTEMAVEIWGQTREAWLARRRA